MKPCPIRAVPGEAVLELRAPLFLCLGLKASSFWAAATTLLQNTTHLGKVTESHQKGPGRNSVSEKQKKNWIYKFSALFMCHFETGLLGVQIQKNLKHC